MIKLIPELPENVLGAVASGQVTAKDYETVLMPAIEKAIHERGKVRFLYHLGPGFDGYSPAAMWDDMKVGFAHLKAWEKLALVTDHEWIAGAMRVFGFAMPCPVRVFSNAQYAEAVAWISAD